MYDCVGVYVWGGGGGGGLGRQSQAQSELLCMATHAACMHCCGCGDINRVMEFGFVLLLQDGM